MGMCKCGGLTKAVPERNYPVPGALLGVEGVTLVEGVVDERCEKCRKGRIHIPDIPGLISAVALTRVKLPFKLNHREIKFLRKAMNFSSKQLAGYLKVTPETLSRWENEKIPISEQGELLLRLIVVAMVQQKAEAVDPEMDEAVQRKVQAAYDPDELRSQMQFRYSPMVSADKKKKDLWQDEQKEKKAA